MSTVVTKKVAKLICVGVDIRETGQSNKFYNMLDNGDGTFTVEYGRVGSTKTTQTYPMKDWDKKIREKLKHGYADVTELSEVKEVSVAKTVDSEGDKLLTLLQSFAKGSIAKEYLVSSSQVTQKQVDKAQELIDTLANVLNDPKVIQKDVNNLLLDIYKTIPRKMQDVRSHILQVTNLTADEIKWAKTKSAEEQELLDRMAGQVLLKETSNTQKGISEAMGISVSLVTDNSIIDHIKTFMADDKNRIVRVWEIKNENSYKKLSIWPETKIDLLFHGSRNENWFNITQSGLLIKPAGVHHAGSMFGNAVYFANKARKSIGYTSINNSYWAKGNSNTAFLALYEVKCGNKFDIYKHESYCYNLDQKFLDIKKCQSVHAHAGQSLLNDEIMIYEHTRCSIKYLIEFK